MKNLLIISFLLIVGLNGFGQDKLNLKWVIDTCSFNGEVLNIDSVSITLKRRKYKEVIFWENDSIKLRASFRYSTRFNRVVKVFKVFKVRFDIYDNNKWHKAPISIDTHGGKRFRINRTQCWGRTSFGYNARYPFTQYCQCYGELKGKGGKKYPINLFSTIILSK